MALEEAPPFWWKKAGWQAWALSPLSYLYGKGSSQRMGQRPTESVDVPVICIGNLIVGGAGKTPTAMLIAKFAKRAKLKPGFLSRGYGGGISKTTLVDLEKHNAHDVGDEPLLLAGIAKTVISADRAAGAKMLVKEGCNFIVMDDGFQNPKLTKDFSLVVVDSKRGIGNGFSMPAGPLRVPLKSQLLLASAILVIGDAPGADKIIRFAARAGKPVFHASTRIVDPAKWKNRQVIAYAGIADPSKLFDSLREAGAEVIETIPFGDHHHFTKDEANELIKKSKLRKMQLVTTSKDRARLHGVHKHQTDLAAVSEVLQVELVFDEPTVLQRVVRETLNNAKRRRHKSRV